MVDVTFIGFRSSGVFEVLMSDKVQQSLLRTPAHIADERRSGLRREKKWIEKREEHSG
jgi:hypothetical protein